MIVSAPTSFGKTFCIFEYIVRYEPKNIVLIVPTLALIDEYLKKIVKKYKNKFSKYKVHTTLDLEKKYNFNEKNIFILTHDRIVQEDLGSVLKEIDFLVIDEVYNLKKDIDNDRVLVLNMAYYRMAKISKKYVLLAPFISSIEDIEKLDKKPKFYKSSYSPVVNDVEVVDIFDENDRYYECEKIVNKFDKSSKTLIYFPTVTGLYKYIDSVIVKQPCLCKLNEDIKKFIRWAKEEIHEEWGLVKALERGYLIHNGQIPIGTRIFQLDFYEESTEYNKLLCTSTLLEGVNTSAENIVITKPARKSKKDSLNFTAFDFFNLVGRTGRLNKHLIGKAYYLKGIKDPEYRKDDAIKSIKFELTDESKDIDIQIGSIEKHKDVQKFLDKIGITLEEYKVAIGSRQRFDTVFIIYENYIKMKNILFKELLSFLTDSKQGRFYIINVLYNIIEGKENKLSSSIINKLLNKKRMKIKSIVNSIRSNNHSIDLNFLIATVIRMKMSYIENDFYSKVLLIKFFMEKEKQDTKVLRGILDSKVIKPIELLYFTNTKHKKMLIDLGVYERDVDKIIRIIGDDFEDAVELKDRLSNNIHNLKKISFISQYVIQNLIN